MSDPIVLFYLTTSVSLAINVFFTAFLVIFISFYASILFVICIITHGLSRISIMTKKWTWTLLYLIIEIEEILQVHISSSRKHVWLHLPTYGSSSQLY
uniref:Ovule protein n=1 Tax=Heterorhabditis bacteriophora TaxID=37862 RepID=A0A1I7XPG2_HETBA